MEWKRPDTIPYPTVWTRFEGPKAIDGVKPQFWIQDVPEDKVDVLAETMLIDMEEEEPLCKYSKFYEDEISVAEGVKKDKRSLRSTVSCVCMTSDSKGNPKIVGVCCLDRMAKSDPKSQVKGEAAARLKSLVDYVYNLKEPFECFGVDEYLRDGGIYVLPEYRGQGIGFEFVKCWSIICKAVGLKVVVGTFTSKFSQRIAEQAGLKELVSISYEELAKIDPKYDLPGIQDHTKYLKILYDTV